MYSYAQHYYRGSASTSPVLTADVTGDTHVRYLQYVSGAALWGPGNSSSDLATGRYSSGGAAYFSSSGGFWSEGVVRAKGGVDAGSASQFVVSAAGKVTAGEWNGTTIGATYGGTGATSVSSGDLLYGFSSNVWARLAKGSDGKVLKLVSGLPSWETESAGGVSFSDAAGDPADVSTSTCSDGTSNYAARLDHVHKLAVFTGDSGSGGVAGSVPAPSSNEGLSTLSNGGLKYLAASGSWTNQGMVPIGSIIGWAKSLGSITAPAGWVECNGGTVADSSSPIYGVTIPNLNGSGGSDKRLLRGSSTSGTIGGSDTHVHWHTTTYICPGREVQSPDKSCWSGGPGPICTGSTSTWAPYYEVVFILRIK